MVASKVLATDAQFVLDYFFPKTLSRRNSGGISSGMQSSRSAESDAEATLAEMSPLGSARSISMSRPEQDYHKQNLDYLFAFVYQDQELNEVLAGYFERVVRSLLEKKQKEFLAYFFNNEKNSQSLEKHIYNRSICILYEKLINIRVVEDYQLTESLNSSRVDRSQYFARFTEKRLEALKSLVDLMHSSRQKTVIDGIKEVLLNFVSDVENVFDYLIIFKGLFFDKKVLATLADSIKNSTIPKKRAAASQILTKALFHINLKGENYKEEISNFFKSKKEEEKNELFQMIVDELENFVEEVKEIKTEATAVVSSCGTDQLVFGLGNIKLIEFFAGCIELRNPRIDVMITNSPFFEICFVREILIFRIFLAFSL